MQIFSQWDFGPMNLHKNSHRLRRMRHRSNSLDNWSSQNSNSLINDPGDSDRVERGSAVRGSLGIFNACERLRARRSPGNVLASKKAMTANTIMTWTIMRPFRMYLRHGILRMVRLRDFQTGLSVRLLDLSRTKKNAGRLVGGGPHDSRSPYYVLIPGST